MSAYDPILLPMKPVANTTTQAETPSLEPQTPLLANLGEALERVRDDIGALIPLFAPFAQMGGKGGPMEKIDQLLRRIHELAESSLEEDVCDNQECRSLSSDGEGFDGYCGSCADHREEAGEYPD